MQLKKSLLFLFLLPIFANAQETLKIDDIRVIVKSQVRREIISQELSERHTKYREIEINERIDIKTTVGHFIAPHLIIIHNEGLADGYDSQLEVQGAVAKVFAKQDHLVFIVTTLKGPLKSHLDFVVLKNLKFDFATQKTTFYNARKLSKLPITSQILEGNAVEEILNKLSKKCSKIADWKYEEHGFEKPKC